MSFLLDHFEDDSARDSDARHIDLRVYRGGNKDSRHCPSPSNQRGCMLRHAHAVRTGSGSQCESCATGRARMATGRPVAARPAPTAVVRCEPEAPASAVSTPEEKQPVSEWSISALQAAVRDALPKAEACAIGCAHLGLLVGADAQSVVLVLEREGLTIFKNECAFLGLVQPCVSVNKRLLAWVEV